jgi:hypothetical protein
VLLDNGSCRTDVLVFFLEHPVRDGPAGMANESSKYSPKSSVRDGQWQHRFHFVEIPDSWLKVDVQEALMPNVSLMMENREAEQEKVKDAVGSCVLWNQKYMKCTT